MGGLLHLVQRGGVWALAHLTRKIVSEMTYNVSSGTLNTTILYYTILYCTKCNSPPINGQCTNFILFDVSL